MADDKHDLKPMVLDELRRHGNKTRAARRAGINRRTLNRWVSTDKVFARAAKVAIREAKS